ncbi:MAG: oligosaccharide flippase family protein [Solirubrobacterales bacterium]
MTGAPPTGDSIASPPSSGRRRLAARGTLINSGFQIGVGSLNMLRTLIVAGFLTTTDFGIWGIVLLTVSFAGVMKGAAIGDKYIQQAEEDQELAFQKAFTLDLLFAGLFFVLMCAVAPLLALAYGQWELVAPALALAVVLPTSALHSPVWVFYRRMDFLRQRLVLSVEPIAAFVVTIALAATGFGYWSLVVGVIAGSTVGAGVAMAMAPIRPRLVYDRGTMWEYLHFSWPLVVAAGGGILMGQFSLLLGNAALGLAAAGAIALASSISLWTDSIDRIITQTLYPAICRVVDRKELLLETFTKSNRLTLLWGMPFGIGLALFAPDLVEFGIGDKWDDAVVLLQVFGLAAAINHIGFNWHAFYRATGRTRPIMVVGVAGFVALLGIGGPLLFVNGLDGYAIGVGAMTVITLVLRWHFVRRFFPGFPIARYIARAIAPTVPAAAAVLAMRLAESDDRAGSLAAIELGVYLLVTVWATLMLERGLLREAVGYLRRRRAGGAAPTLSPSGSGG